jgi:hypothetical protein
VSRQLHRRFSRAGVVWATGSLAAAIASLVAAVAAVAAIAPSDADRTSTLIALSVPILFAVFASYGVITIVRRDTYTASSSIRLANAVDQISVAILRYPELRPLLYGADRVTIAGNHYLRLLLRERAELEQFARRGGEMRVILAPPDSTEPNGTDELSMAISELWHYLSGLKRSRIKIGFLRRDIIDVIRVDNDVLVINLMKGSPRSKPIYIVIERRTNPELFARLSNYIDDIWMSTQWVDSLKDLAPLISSEGQRT